MSRKNRQSIRDRIRARETQAEIAEFFQPPLDAISKEDLDLFRHIFSNESKTARLFPAHHYPLFPGENYARS